MARRTASRKLRVVAVRRLVLLAAVLALALVVGDAQLVLTIVPFALIAAFPLAGRFPGEALIVARRLARPRLRPVRRSRPLPAALTSLLERSPRSLRGPPVPA